VACSPTLSFSGAYQLTHTFTSGMPVYICDSPDPHVIEYREKDAVWHIRQCTTGQVIAISCAVSSGFPAPILWTLLDTSFPFVPSRSFPIAVYGASQAGINGIYFPHAAMSSAAACARQLRSGASLEFCTAENHWVLNHATDGPRYIFCPNSPQSNTTVALRDQTSGATQRLHHLPFSDDSSIGKSFPNFDDGEWKVFPHCSSAPSHDDAPKCRLLDFDTRPIVSSASFNCETLEHTSQFCLDIPPHLFVAAVSAGSDAALFEGHYRFVDLMTIQRTSNLQVLFLNDESGHQLLLVISSVWIERICLTVDGEVLFERVAQEEPPLASLLSNDHSFFIDLFQFPRTQEAAPAFKVMLPKGTKALLPQKLVAQPHMMPAFTDPAFINRIKKMMTQPKFDAQSFWRHVLAQMSGHAEAADSSSLHRVLVRCLRYCHTHLSTLTPSMIGTF
jgi:hypothetical protein